LKIIKKIALGIAGLLLVASSLSGKEKDSTQSVDSGSFGVFINGRRVATETFSVRQQSPSASSVSSQLKDENGGAAQSSQMQITSTGALVRYEWHELSPGKSTVVVVPNNEFLLETVTEKPGEKPVEQPFLLPNTSPILDNNFFVHRQILAWRYLGSSCTSELAGLKCGPGEFGVLIPQARSSSRITVQPVGDESLNIRGTEQKLLRVDFKGDDGEWSLWLNTKDHYKLMRITKVGEQVEVVRD
jgi:hypothetical protein